MTGRATRHLCAGRNRERDRCRACRPSQGNRVVKHVVSNEWVKSTLFSDVHSTAQFLFQIEKQPTREPRRRTRTGLNQEIEVAVRARVASRKGTEHTNPLNAVPCGDGENRGALILAQLIEGHAYSFSHQRQSKFDATLPETRDPVRA